ncbi:hypothetical protein H4R35_001127 [Dimargaris xerosporica]|nr:hypothetical protein H4R35_001127 [Dimargaris xerosporica]
MDMAHPLHTARPPIPATMLATRSADPTPDRTRAAHRPPPRPAPPSMSLNDTLVRYGLCPISNSQTQPHALTHSKLHSHSPPPSDPGLPLTISKSHQPHKSRKLSISRLDESIVSLQGSVTSREQGDDADNFSLGAEGNPKDSSWHTLKRKLTRTFQHRMGEKNTTGDRWEQELDDWVLLHGQYQSQFYEEYSQSFSGSLGCGQGEEEPLRPLSLESIVDAQFISGRTQPSTRSGHRLGPIGSLRRQTRDHFTVANRALSPALSRSSLQIAHPSVASTRVRLSKSSTKGTWPFSRRTGSTTTSLSTPHTPVDTLFAPSSLSEPTSCCSSWTTYATEDLDAELRERFQALCPTANLPQARQSLSIDENLDSTWSPSTGRASYDTVYRKMLSVQCTPQDMASVGSSQKEPHSLRLNLGGIKSHIAQRVRSGARSTRLLNKGTLKRFPDSLAQPEDARNISQPIPIKVADCKLSTGVGLISLSEAATSRLPHPECNDGCAAPVLDHAKVPYGTLSPRLGPRLRLPIAEQMQRAVTTTPVITRTQPSSEKAPSSMSPPRPPPRSAYRIAPSPLEAPNQAANDPPSPLAERLASSVNPQGSCSALPTAQPDTLTDAAIHPGPHGPPGSEEDDPQVLSYAKVPLMQVQSSPGRFAMVQRVSAKSLAGSRRWTRPRKATRHMLSPAPRSPALPADLTADTSHPPPTIAAGLSPSAMPMAKREEIPMTSPDELVAVIHHLALIIYQSAVALTGVSHHPRAVDDASSTLEHLMTPSTFQAIETSRANRALGPTAMGHDLTSPSHRVSTTGSSTVESRDEASTPTTDTSAYALHAPLRQSGRLSLPPAHRLPAKFLHGLRLSAYRHSIALVQAQLDPLDKPTDPPSPKTPPELWASASPSSPTSANTESNEAIPSAVLAPPAATTTLTNIGQPRPTSVLACSWDLVDASCPKCPLAEPWPPSPTTTACSSDMSPEPPRQNRLRQSIRYSSIRHPIHHQPSARFIIHDDDDSDDTALQPDESMSAELVQMIVGNLFASRPGSTQLAPPRTDLASSAYQVELPFVLTHPDPDLEALLARLQQIVQHNHAGEQLVHGLPISDLRLPDVLARNSWDAVSPTLTDAMAPFYRDLGRQ